LDLGEPTNIGVFRRGVVMISATFRGRLSSGRLVRKPAAILLACLMCMPAMASADVVLNWNAIAARTVLVGHSPFSQARLMSIVQLAVFEAVNAITGEYEPYLKGDDAIVAPDGASAEAAAIVAAHRVLKTFFMSNTSIDTDRANALAAIPDGQAKTDGIAVGEAAAAALLALRASDGSSPATFYLPTSSANGEWQTTPNCPAAELPNAGGQFYHWQDVTPFGISDPADFLLPAPPSLTSNQYTKDYNEVKTVGDADSTARSTDRAEVARLYGATSPTFALSMAARQILATRDGSLADNARALALIMMGSNDSLIASFYNKYHYNFWRPETAIQRGATDGNAKTEGDMGYAPFIGTPCFPSYPSNHASGTNGGLEMMRRLFGAAGHDITITNNVPALGSLLATTITRHYTQLKQIADDVDDARVYGGIHYRFDQEGGNALGRAIATEIYKNYLRPVHPQP
jgi:hypothetical protein